MNNANLLRLKAYDDLNEWIGSEAKRIYKLLNPKSVYDYYRYMYWDDQGIHLEASYRGDAQWWWAVVPLDKFCELAILGDLND